MCCSRTAQSSTRLIAGLEGGHGGGGDFHPTSGSPRPVPLAPFIFTATSPQTTRTEATPMATTSYTSTKLLPVSVSGATAVITAEPTPMPPVTVTHEAARPTRQAQPTVTHRILCCGDSLTAGFFPGGAHAPWSVVLAQKLGVNVDEIGMSGWRCVAVPR